MNDDPASLYTHTACLGSDYKDLRIGTRLSMIIKARRECKKRQGDGLCSIFNLANDDAYQRDEE